MIIGNGLFENIDLNDTNIEISSKSNCKVIDIIETNFERNFILGENTYFIYRLICFESLEYKVNITLPYNNSKCDISVIILSKNGKVISGDININLLASNCISNCEINAYVGNNGNIKANGNIFIGNGIFKVEGHLKEKSIYLYDSGKIFLQPKLDINSNDVIASHGAKIDKLDFNKLFYLTSKGISLRDTQKLLLESYFTTFFSLLDQETSYYDKFINYIIS